MKRCRARARARPLRSHQADPLLLRLEVGEEPLRQLGAHVPPKHLRHDVAEVGRDPQIATLVERVRRRLGLTSLRYQYLPDLVHAIGLPKEKLCTYCWDKAE